MTDSTALAISNMLLDLFKQHGFECIGTFNLPDFAPGFEYNEFKEDYKYMDTDTGFNDLKRYYTIPGEAVYGLRRILDVSLDFFEKAESIPAKFTRLLSEMSNQEKVPLLVMENLNEGAVNLEEIISNQNSQYLIQLLTTIKDHIDEPDETVLSRLDQINES